MYVGIAQTEVASASIMAFIASSYHSFN
jgi:hypothetical protein